MSKEPVNHFQSRLKKLRNKAESKLAKSQAESATPKELKQAPIESVDVLLHELQVHQIELEMQNDELMKINLSEQILRNRYNELYEFAPIAYLTINADGLITNINSKAAFMLGIDRNNKNRFASFLVDQDKDRWHLIFMRLKKQAIGAENSVCLMLKHGNGSVFYGQIDCRRAKDHDALGVINITIADVSQIKQSESDLRIAATAFESQEGIFITDIDTVILKINRAATNLAC